MKLILLTLFGILLVGSISALEVTQNITATVLLGDFGVYSPLNDTIYGESNLLINASLNGKVNYIKYSDNGENFKILCRNCDSVARKRTFEEGKHRLIVSAFFDSGSFSKIINFTVDSEKPKIVRASPKKDFANGIFKFTYIEDNPTKIKVHYGTDTKELNISKECFREDGSKACRTNVSLNKYDGQEIFYWIEMGDIAGSIAESKKTKVKVDVTLPVVTNPTSFFSYQNNSKYIYFHIGVEETNFDKANFSYKELNGKLKEGNLCTNLKNGFCDKKMTFKKGKYNMTINVLDKAGNYVSLNPVFVVDN